MFFDWNDLIFYVLCVQHYIESYIVVTLNDLWPMFALIIQLEYLQQLPWLHSDHYYQGYPKGKEQEIRESTIVENVIMLI